MKEDVQEATHACLQKEEPMRKQNAQLPLPYCDLKMYLIPLLETFKVMQKGVLLMVKGVFVSHREVLLHRCPKKRALEKKQQKFP